MKPRSNQLDFEPIFLTMAFTLVTIFGAFSYADGDADGGGGALVQCPADHQDRPPIQLLDVAEGIYSSGKKIDPVGRDHEEQISFIIEEVAKYDEQFARRIRASIMRIKKDLVKVDKVYLANDHGNILPGAIPKDCNLKWFAFWYDWESKIEVQKDLFEQLTDTDLTAWYLHEAIYRIARTLRADEISSQIRRAVAALLENPASEESKLRMDRLHDKPFSYRYYMDMTLGELDIKENDSLLFNQQSIENGDKLGDCKGGPDLYTDIMLCQPYVRFGYEYDFSETETYHLKRKCKKLGTLKRLEVHKNTRNTTPRQVTVSGKKVLKQHKKLIKKIRKKDEVVRLSQPIIRLWIGESMKELCEMVTYDGPYFTTLGSADYNLPHLLEKGRKGNMLLVTGDRDPSKQRYGISYDTLRKNGYEMEEGIQSPYGLIDPLGSAKWGIVSEVLFSVQSKEK